MIRKWVAEIKDGWGLLSPRWRMALRTAAFGVITYVYSSLSDGNFNINSLVDAIKVSVTYAVLGLLTPLEPFVGVNKPAVVGVPSSAVEEPTP